jgi:pheromone shutdown protein TraB
MLKDLLEDDDMVTHLLKELSLEYPEVLLPLVHDRNWYLAVRIWRYARLTRRPLVAVLGKAHLQGVVHALLYLSIVALRMVEQQQAELQEQAGPEVADEDVQAGQG